MYPSLTPPRQVKIGDAAAFAGTTPRAIRHYHAIGLLPEPERGGDGRRRYGYDDMIRLLWIRRMADAGISLDDMRAAFGEAQDETRDESGDGASDQAPGIESVLGRLEESLAAQEAAVEQPARGRPAPAGGGQSAGAALRTGHGPAQPLPPGALRPSDLDALLVTERICGPLGAAIQASAFIVLATHPDLRAEDDRLEAAEAALDDGVAPDDPRVEALAVQRCAHQMALDQAIEAAGLEAAEAKILETYDAGLTGEEGREMSAATAVTKMPYDFSPARMRCLELAGRLFGEALADAHPADGS